MAHIHLPDGVFSLQWVIIWWALALAVLAIALLVARRQTFTTQRLTTAALLAAVSFAISQVNIPFAGGVHMNLTPLIGILAGPAIGSLIVLIVNILSAAIGHGGWGLIGANTIVNVSEVVSAYYLFYYATRRFELFTRGAVAAFGGLLVGNVLGTHHRDFGNTGKHPFGQCVARVHTPSSSLKPSRGRGRSDFDRICCGVFGQGAPRFARPTRPCW